jgi:hypothetical protein
MNIKFNKRVFVENILTPASKLSDNVCLDFNNSELKVLVPSTDNSIILFASLPYSSTDENTKIIIPETKTFLRLISGIEENDINLDFNSNVVEYKSSTLSFKYHLLDDSYISNNRAFSEEKLNKITYDTCFEIAKTKLSEILKYNSIIPDAEKLYFYTKDDKVFAKIGDEQKCNTNEINIEISLNYADNSLETAIPINIQNVLLTSFVDERINVSINHQLKIFKFETPYTKYIISGLVK